METRIITGENAGGPLAQEQLRKASFLARLGSGSACRSLFPGFALWGETDGWAGSGNEYAIPVDNYHEVFRDMRDSILIVESGRKKVSSSTGHSLMASNPFADTRFRQARMNLDRLSRILGEGNWDAFIEVMEEEALSLHAMMMTGKPGYLLMRPGTLAILEKVRSFREKKGARLGFTLDAGANVHLLYPPQEESRVHEFMNARLLEHCENRQVIHDRMGAGPQLRGI
jgi:diphosphomevalonate decarboxylase